MRLKEFNTGGITTVYLYLCFCWFILIDFKDVMLVESYLFDLALPFPHLSSAVYLLV